MGAFLVEQYWPGVTAGAAGDCVARIREALCSTSPSDGACRLVSSVLLDDETLLSLFEAVSDEAIIAMYRRAGVPLDRVTSCVVLAT